MRHAVLGLLASTVVAISAVPANACAFNAFCALNHTGYGSYGFLGVAPYERLPQPAGVYKPAPRPREAQFYHVNQGPTFSGPGQFAPYPSYQETAVRGWRGYERGYDYPYDGGPYGNAVNHYSDVAPEGQGPAIYSYRWRRGHSFRPRVQYFGIRPDTRAGYVSRGSGYRMASPGVVYAPRVSAARHQYPRPPRRAD